MIFDDNDIYMQFYFDKIDFFLIFGYRFIIVEIICCIVYLYIVDCKSLRNNDLSQIFIVLQLDICFNLYKNLKYLIVNNNFYRLIFFMILFYGFFKFKLKLFLYVNFEKK